MLEPHEETGAKRGREHDDLEACTSCQRHLRLVIRIATDIAAKGVKDLGMISEGNIGPDQAVKRLEPRKGSPVAT